MGRYVGGWVRWVGGWVGGTYLYFSSSSSSSSSFSVEFFGFFWVEWADVRKVVGLAWVGGWVGGWVEKKEV